MNFYESHYHRWADPECPACHGVGARLSDDPDRDDRVACHCVTHRMDVDFCEALTPLLGPPVWDTQAKPVIHPLKHNLIECALDTAAPFLYRSISVWRRVPPPWANQYTVVTPEILMDRAFGKEDAVKHMRGHHLIIPLDTLLARRNALEGLGVITSLMTAPPSGWPKFVVYVLSPVSRSVLSSHFYGPSWDAFERMVETPVVPPEGYAVPEREHVKPAAPVKPEPPVGDGSKTRAFLKSGGMTDEAIDAMMPPPVSKSLKV